MSQQSDAEKRLASVKGWFENLSPRQRNDWGMVDPDTFAELHAVLYHAEYKEIEQK